VLDLQAEGRNQPIGFLSSKK